MSEYPKHPYQQPPPPYGMYASPPQPQPTVIHQTEIIVPRMYGPTSTNTVCPSCHKQIATRVEREATGKTHLFALLLCLLFCPCAILPYCMDSCQAAHHYCPSCGTFLGAYEN